MKLILLAITANIQTISRETAYSFGYGIITDHRSIKPLRSWQRVIPATNSFCKN